MDKHLIDSPMYNLSKPKIECAWNCNSNELKPLQNYTDYVPVYGDKGKSPTAINDDKWQMLGRKRCDLLSKYGYASHREAKAIGQCNELNANDNWSPADQNHQIFDNCYILGEPKVGNCLPNHIDGCKTSNRHSFCEYKPFSTRKSDLARLRFFAPIELKPMHFMCDKSTSSAEVSTKNSPTDEEQFSLLTLIGESRLAVCQNICNSIEPITPYPSLNEFDDLSIGPFCENQKDNIDIGVECKQL